MTDQVIKLFSRNSFNKDNLKILIERAAEHHRKGLRIRQPGAELQDGLRGGAKARPLLRVEAAARHHVGGELFAAGVPLGQLCAEERVRRCVLHR